VLSSSSPYIWPVSGLGERAPLQKRYKKSYLFILEHWYMRTYIHTYLHTICVCMDTYMHTIIHACINTYIYKDIHTFIHTYMYMHEYVIQAGPPLLHRPNRENDSLLIGRLILWKKLLNDPVRLQNEWYLFNESSFKSIKASFIYYFFDLIVKKY